VEHVVEVALRERDAALALVDAVLESVPAAFALFDRDFRLTRLNAAMEAFMRTPRASPLGRTILELMPAHAAPLEEIFRAVAASQTPAINVEMSDPAPTPTDDERYWVASVFPVHRGAAAGGGLGLVIVDTTERRALESQLLQAQKMEAVGRLAGGIAHDFNNMLTAVMSYSDLLLQDLALTDPRREDVAEIASAARRAASLTRQLLAFSRQQVLQSWALDLNATVTEIEKMLGRLIGADVEVVTRLDPQLGIVKVDPGQIEQVLMNLAVNARDAMVNGGRLTIETSNIILDEHYVRSHPGIAAGHYVTLSVSDTGSGMTPEVRTRIFEPFFTTKDRGKGTGLGLSTVYGIVKQSGGHITVHSEVGHGTTFRIHLPRVDGAMAAAVPHVREALGHRGSEAILLVEDDVAVRTVVGRILRTSGYVVHEASNGTEALRIADDPATAPDLIITDIVMPEMGGHEFVRRLHDRGQVARLLFMSGYAEYDASDNPSTPGDTPFIEKPFTMEALARKVREVLDRPAPGPAPAAAP
jgi:signal transduction histidine kinase/ActR/RegA family two-component response regulator